MAYKNKKKNKLHVKNLHKKEGLIRKKHEREKRRNNPPRELTFGELGKIMFERGLI